MENGASSTNSGAKGGNGSMSTNGHKKLILIAIYINKDQDDMSDTASLMVASADSLYGDESDNDNSTNVTSLVSSINSPSFNIIDSTLREGEQFATASFTTAQKIAIAKALDDFGVEYIELTSPAASQQSRIDCETICKLGLKAKILTHIRCHMDDAKIAVQTGVDGVNVAIGTSAYLMKYSHGKDLASISEKAKEVIEFVKAHNLEIRFSGEDSFRSNFKDILQLYSSVDKLGVDRVGIADTVGSATPMEVMDKIKALRETVGCDIETHFHNDTGGAIANAYCALEAGATHIDTTVLGIGERNGITPLGGLINCLMNMTGGYKYSVGKYRIETLGHLEKLVAQSAEVEIPFNHTDLLMPAGIRLEKVETGLATLTTYAAERFTI
ncbi:MAG: Saccharopine dehydrogenase [Vezdaea aestivalis]|nr:MAG: Saccharopine dehydrogenase [Vezdaea aestivalis]